MDFRSIKRSRKILLISVAAILLAAGGATAVLAAGQATTGTNVVCATAIASATNASHTVAVDGAGVKTIAGSVKTVTSAKCSTVTYTIPTVTTTVGGTTSVGTTTTTTPTTTTVPITTSSPPPGCTTTISSGLQNALDAASGGETICLNAGTYNGAVLDGADNNYSSTVNVQPVPGAVVQAGHIKIQDGFHNISFNGAGATLKVNGVEDYDWPVGQGGCNGNFSFKNLAFTDGVLLEPSKACSSNEGILLDNDSFVDLTNALFDGRLSINALDAGSGQKAGITISNSFFGHKNGADTGCSDGVFLGGGVSGVQIGPGNEFTGFSQNCGGHIDPIQFYGGENTLVTSNYFHDNGDGSGGIMSPDGDTGYTITNNVFKQTGIYPWAVVMGGCKGCTVTHNVFINGDLEIGTANNGSPASTGIVARDNVFQNAGIVTVGNGNSFSATFNLNSGVSGNGNINGTPVYSVASPLVYKDFALVSQSPGYHAASDGNSMGIVP